MPAGQSNQPAIELQQFADMPRDIADWHFSKKFKGRRKGEMD
jgi:hypothetical protein